MMNILAFVGSRETGFFCEPIAERYNCDVEYIEQSGHIQHQINSILYISKLKYIIYDIGQYIDSPDIITEEIIKIQKCNGATPVIYAPGYLPSSQIITNLYEQGIREFVLSTDLSEQRSQLEKCINGYYAHNGIEELSALQLLSEQEAQLKADLKFTTIGVVGAQERIGTTTQALHIVKYLTCKGYTACYIHINNTNYINELKEWWGADNIDEHTGKLTYEGVDHFYKIEQLSEIKKLGYDFYVYDYGSLTGHFNRESFLERDIKVYVLGWKPPEMQATYRLLQSKIYIDGKYILSFGDELPDEDIEGIMGERIVDTVVPMRCTEPYKLFDPDAYDKILAIEKKQPENDNTKARGLFKFFGGGKK